MLPVEILRQMPATSLHTLVSPITLRPLDILLVLKRQPDQLLRHKDHTKVVLNEIIEAASKSRSSHGYNDDLAAAVGRLKAKHFPDM